MLVYGFGGDIECISYLYKKGKAVKVYSVSDSWGGAWEGIRGIIIFRTAVVVEKGEWNLWTNKSSSRHMKIM